MRMAVKATLARVAPRLTIITPSFNQAAFLERTLTSVLEQGYPDLEYLVVDGGSTDGSVDILRRYSDRLAWWVSEPDEGQTHALHKGLERATGDVVAYINSDDHYLPGAFDAALGALEAQPDARWAVGAARFVQADGTVDLVWHARRPPRRRAQWILGPWSAPQPSSFWRRQVFEELGPFRRDMHYIFDTEFAVRLAFAGYEPAIVDRELSVRVVHPEAKSWDTAPFEREQRRLLALHGGKLTTAERAELRALQAYQRAQIPRLTTALSRGWRRALRRPPYEPPSWTSADGR
jgi:glycosyltransferase involved in cell wall biosynthesis